MLMIRPFTFLNDIDTLLTITVAAFQFEDKPEWSVPDNLAELVRPQFRAFRALYPVWRGLGLLNPDWRTALGGAVAEVDGVPVGVANVIRLRQSQHYEIGNVGVRPESRRQGIARRLVEACIEQAAVAGGATAFLDVISENRGAVRLYEQMGFAEVDHSLELTHAGPAPSPHAPHLPRPYNSVPFGFGDGRYWAALGQQLGKSAIVDDYHYFAGFRRLAPAFFALAQMGFWGRAIVDASATVRGVASLLFQRGSVMGTLGILDAELLPPLLTWLTDTCARRAPLSSLTLSIRHSALPPSVLLHHSELAGFWAEFRHIRMALTLPSADNRVKSLFATEEHRNEVV